MLTEQTLDKLNAMKLGAMAPGRPPSEPLHEALRHGARIGEVCIVFVERRHGHSKVSLNVLAESLVMPWRVRFRSPAGR